MFPQNRQLGNGIRYLWESEEEAREKEEEDNFGSNLLSSLRMLEVRGCDNMERCCCPNSIESLGIGYCSSLTHVSCPNSIESLGIHDCSSLTHVSFQIAAATRGGGQKLKSLYISDCEKLMEKISSGSTPMLESIDIRDWTNLKSIMQLGNFIYLSQLYLFNCPSLESFPDIPLPVLTHLVIFDCKRMESLSALQMKNLNSLNDLTIRNCRGIDASCHGGVWPPQFVFPLYWEVEEAHVRVGPSEFSIFPC
ncbi:putative leucine-rich repeat domain superfamily [Helianthus annuus]|nr:putative leucine-rich repeat domain superfamily [Helianthus annuus]